MTSLTSSHRLPDRDYLGEECVYVCYQYGTKSPFYRRCFFDRMRRKTYESLTDEMKERVDIWRQTNRNRTNRQAPQISRDFTIKDNVLCYTYVYPYGRVNRRVSIPDMTVGFIMKQPLIIREALFRYIVYGEEHESTRYDELESHPLFSLFSDSSDD